MIDDRLEALAGLRTRTSKPAPGAPQPDRDLRFQIYTPGGVFQWENDIECSQLRSRGVNYVRLAGSLVAKVVANSTLTQAECYPGTSNSEQQVLSLNPFRNPFAGATEVVAGNDGGRDGEAPSAPTSTTYSIVYVHTDALGSPLAETNINATVIPGSRTQYEPYGKPLTPTREGAPSYTGHQYDTSTGLIYAQQRYYDPQIGRFLSTDAMAVDTENGWNWNRYSYAANNPYRFTDPDGRAACPTGTRICYDSRRTESGSKRQDGPSAQRVSTDKQVASARRSGNLSDGTRLNLSSAGKEQGFSASPEGTAAANLTGQMCVKCSDGTTRTSAGFDASKLKSNESGGHTHQRGIVPLPGPEDGRLASATGKTAYVISERGGFAIEKTEVGFRVRQIDGAPLTRQEAAEVRSTIDGWNQFQGSSGATCTAGC